MSQFAENDVPQVCTNRHYAGPCGHPLCACIAGHKTPHHDAQGRPIPPGGGYYAYDLPTLERAAEHNCLDEDVDSGDPLVCRECAFPPAEPLCTDCGDPAEFTACREDFGDRCASCHVASCASCQDDLADQDAAEAARDGWRT